MDTETLGAIVAGGLFLGCFVKRTNLEREGPFQRGQATDFLRLGVGRGVADCLLDPFGGLRRQDV